MTLPDLLERARQLAKGGHAESSEVEGLATSLGRAQAALALQKSAAKEYAKDEASARAAINGRARPLEFWQTAEALLNEAEESVLEGETNLQALRAELRRLVVLAEHSKGKAAREEARA